MTNNLRKIKKDLCSFAKKCREFKYTDSALITFLITGGISISNNLFSSEADKSIEAQKQTISTSIKDIHSQFTEARKENNKLLKNTNLELIQLMEQGDHVVKSPWSSWQYGINGFSNNWGQTYKGRGDKSEKYPYEGKFERSENTFEKYTSPLSPSYKLLGKSKDFKTALSNKRTEFKSGYGLSSTEKRQERIASLNIDATIKPKEIHKTAITAPNINIDSPILAPLSVPTVVPATLTIPKPKPPKVEVALPEISAKPFVDFSYQNGVLGWYAPSSFSDDKKYRTVSDSRFNNGEGLKFWTGYNPDTNQLVDQSGVEDSQLTQGYVGEGNSFKRNMNNRTGALLYFNSYKLTAQPPSSNKFHAKNFELYIAGKVGNAGIIGKIPGTQTTAHRGALGIHAVWNGRLSNITANLYGRAAFLSLETWWAGKMEFDDSGNGIKVNIKKAPNVTESGDENTIFLIYPGTYASIRDQNSSFGATKQRGGFIGKVDAEIDTDKNIIYSVLGAQGSYEIKSEGIYTIKGDNNIVYSGYGYVPNWNNLIRSGGAVQDRLEEGMTPSIKLEKAPIITGNNNVVLLFNSIMNPSQAEEIDVFDKYNNLTNKALWRSSPVGIYQGEIRAKAQIGTAVPSVTEMAENNVGIYSMSGQRGEETINGQLAKIVPSVDLGADDTRVGDTTMIQYILYELMI